MFERDITTFCAEVHERQVDVCICEQSGLKGLRRAVEWMNVSAGVMKWNLTVTVAIICNCVVCCY